MKGNGSLFPLSQQTPVIQVAVSLLIFLASSLLFVTLLYASGSLVFSDWTETRTMLGEGNIEGASPAIIRFLQAGQGFGIFILPAIIISYMMFGDFTTLMGIKKPPAASLIVMVFLLAFFVIIVNTFTAWLNSKIVFPASLEGVENWMRTKELIAGRYTVLLTSSTTSPNLAVNIIIIALLAALGEEFFFRGVIQQLFTNLSKNGVLAVWITALLFSTVHLQFFGFIPRLILGLIYGYLFLWSGSIWLPVTAHFINNLIPVTIAYYRGWNEGTKSSEQFVTDNPIMIVIAVIAAVALLYAIRKELKMVSRSE